MTTRKKVLLVCMVDSIHVARWLEMFFGEEIDFILFPSTPNRRIHPRVKNLIHRRENQVSSVKIVPFGGFFSIPLFVLDTMLSNTFRGYILSRLVKKHEIDYLHALELNHGGYIMSRSQDFYKPNSVKYVATNWGSDIYWFQQFPGHLRKIEKLLDNSDVYSAECVRDLELASKYGFKGDFMDVFPNAGGFPVKWLSEDLTAPSTRRLILIKGYESFVGRASIGLSALEALAGNLTDFEIIVYSANYKTIRTVKRIKKKHQLNIKYFSKGQLSHDEMLDLFKRARVYLGVSLSDGISTSLLEAMSTGAFPIQTDTSCANEWIENGVSGFIVPVDVGKISKALSESLMNNVLVDSAMNKNLAIARSRLDSDSVKQKALFFYQN
jgi:glycosyltransferase involved in cell wall biosynthesis